MVRVLWDLTPAARTMARCLSCSELRYCLLLRGRAEREGSGTSGLRLLEKRDPNKESEKSDWK
jgi:hypothetical protein